MPEKVMMIGSNGQLGSEIVRQLQTGGSVLGTIPGAFADAEIIALDIPLLDITHQEQTLRTICEYRPTVIINCAAYTNVDGCESHPDEAFLVNAIGVRNIARAADQVHAKLLHVSTDYVFAGDGTLPYSEYDQPNPDSVYGKTKLLGERYMQQFCSRWFIVRTAWLYGANGKNFVKTIINAARAKGAVTVVDDQFGNPTNAEDLAYHILKIAATEQYGIYHCTGTGICSWYDFACRIIDKAGIDAAVHPCTTKQYASPTKRPAYSALEHRMLRLTVGDQMRPWETALEQFLQEQRGKI